MTSRKLEIAIKYREAKQFDKAKTILDELIAQEPENPQINYQAAWLCDVQGKERDAVPYYERAIQNGLVDDDLRGALLGLGSTYRCLGEYDKSIAVLRQGIEKFADAREFAVFLAMALYNQQQCNEAMQLLLANLIETTSDPDILRYKNAITFYQDKLNEVWE